MIAGGAPKRAGVAAEKLMRRGKTSRATKALRLDAKRKRGGVIGKLTLGEAKAILAEHCPPNRPGDDFTQNPIEAMPLPERGQSEIDYEALYAGMAFFFKYQV